MQISLDSGSAKYRISAYGDGFLKINDDTFDTSVLVHPERPAQPWRPKSVDELSSEDIRELSGVEVEIIIIGTGPQQIFPPMDLLAPMYDRAIGFEIMDTRAACRTYNILMAEGRDVLAALIQI